MNNPTAFGPDAPTERQLRIARITKIALAVFTVAFFAWIIIGVANSPTNNRDDDDRPREASAYEIRGACEDVVSERLRSPSTAEFNSTATSTGHRTWTVTGTVDAENGFGAMVRESFECSVRDTDDQTFTRLISFG